MNDYANLMTENMRLREELKRMKFIAWKAGLTLANNLCCEQSDRYNNDDETDKADAARECAAEIRSWIFAEEKQIEIYVDAGIDYENMTKRD